MPGAQPGAAPGLSAWSMPTLDPEELEKRIQDLKTVQFWLEQNARMISMTIQGLEVQRMTLSTLKGMNVSMDALRESLKARADTPAGSPSPQLGDSRSGSDDAAPAASANGAEASAANDLINPMRWWDTLTQQFTHMASQAAQTVNDSVGESMDMIKQAQAKAAEAAETATRSVTTAAPAAATDARKQTPAAPPRKTSAKAAPGASSTSGTRVNVRAAATPGGTSKGKAPGA
jgi:hypothetical protein